MRSFMTATTVCGLLVLNATLPTKAVCEENGKFASPQAVFEQYARVRTGDDPAQLYRCLSSDYRQFMVAGSLFPVEPTLGTKSLADKFVDRDALRKRLREVLPVSDAEALQIVKELVKDPETAFVAAMKSHAEAEEEHEKQRAAKKKEGDAPAIDLNEGKPKAPPVLKNLKIEGDHAVAIISHPGDKESENLDEKQASKQFFVKEDGEWRIDLSPDMEIFHR